MRAFVIVLCSIHTFATGFLSSARQPRIRTKISGGYDATVGTNPSTPIQFFTMPGNTCPYAQRTHIALLELSLPFDTTEISGIPKPDWYLMINPRGKVPALRIPTESMAAVCESAICNEFLCDYATKLQLPHTLMPAEPFMKAKIRLLNYHCDDVYAKTQFTYLMNKDDAMDGDLCTQMENALKYYEESLIESKGPYLMGEFFTVADLHVFPFIQRLRITLKHWKHYELPNDKFPNLLLWHDACLERETVKASSMTNDKTIEVYERFVTANYSFGGLNMSK